MKRQPCCLAALFLFLAVGAFAQPAQVAAGGTKPPSPGKIEASGPQFRIGADLRTGSPQIVQMEAWVDHQLAFTETVRLPRDVNAVSVELLRGHPQILSALRALGSSASVRVLLDGLPLGDLPLAGAAKGHGSEAGEPVYGATRLEIFANDLFPEPEDLIRDLAQVMGNSTACQDTCDSDYSACMAQNCPQQLFCEYCDQQKAQCLDDCICYDNPNAVRYVSYYYGPTTTSCFSTGSSACFNQSWAPFSPAWHTIYFCCQKRNYYRHSVYCDGHWVDELVSTQNQGCFNCYQSSGVHCSSPSGSPSCNYYP